MLLSQEPVTFGPASKIVHLLGLACYCMACNGHYRARPQAWIRPLPWVLGLLGAGVMACAIFLLASPGSSHWSGAFGMVLLVVSCVFLSRLLDISRRLWWRLVPLKKIYTYQEGFM